MVRVIMRLRLSNPYASVGNNIPVFRELVEEAKRNLSIPSYVKVLVKVGLSAFTVVIPWLDTWETLPFAVNCMLRLSNVVLPPLPVVTFVLVSHPRLVLVSS